MEKITREVAKYYVVRYSTPYKTDEIYDVRDTKEQAIEDFEKIKLFDDVTDAWIEYVEKKL